MLSAPLHLTIHLTERKKNTIKSKTKNLFNQLSHYVSPQNNFRHYRTISQLGHPLSSFILLFQLGSQGKIWFGRKSWLGVLSPWVQRICAAFWMIFSGKPHLTIFGAPKSEETVVWKISDTDQYSDVAIQNAHKQSRYPMRKI